MHYPPLPLRAAACAWSPVLTAAISSPTPTHLPADNLLTRGQSIADDIDESDAVDIVLRPGQFSLHHGHTFHGSHANHSEDRRIGFSFNYISPAMFNRDGNKMIVRLVRGEDRHGHYELAHTPSGLFAPQDVELLRRSKAIAEDVYYKGTDKRLATDSIGREVGS